MTNEEQLKQELEVLQQLEAVSEHRFRPGGYVVCGCIEYEGKLIPIEEHCEIQRSIIPPRFAGEKITALYLTCGSAEDCKQGKYPPVDQHNRQHLSKDEPHCWCYERLKRQYGNDLPEATKRYAYRQRPKNTDKYGS